MWSTDILGLYSFALSLSKIPIDKFVPLINEVSFPAFSTLQDNKSEFNLLFLRSTKIIATIIIPVYVTAFLLSDELVKLFLTSKWLPIIPLFKWLCIAQIPIALNSISNFVHTAQGRPHWGTLFQVACVLILPVSFFIAARQSIQAFVIPWITVSPVLIFFWFFLTIRKIGIPLYSYIAKISHPLIATCFMTAGILSVRTCLSFLVIDHTFLTFLLSSVAAVAIYVSYFLIADKSYFHSIYNMLLHK